MSQLILNQAQTNVLTTFNDTRNTESIEQAPLNNHVQDLDAFDLQELAPVCGNDQDASIEEPYTNAMHIKSQFEIAQNVNQNVMQNVQHGKSDEGELVDPDDQKSSIQNNNRVIRFTVDSNVSQLSVVNKKINLSLNAFKPSFYENSKKMMTATVMNIDQQTQKRRPKRDQLYFQDASNLAHLVLKEKALQEQQEIKEIQIRGRYIKMLKNPLRKFRILNIIKRFVQIMILQLRSRTYNGLLMEHFDIINDAAHYCQEKSQNRLQEILTNSEFIFQPGSKGYFFWNFLLMCATLVAIMLIPFHFAFTEFNDYYIERIFKVIGAFLSADLLVQLNTGVYKGGTFIMDRIHICKHVFGVYFIIELASTITLLAPDNYFRLINIWRIFHLKQIFLLFDGHFVITHRFQTLLSLLRLSALILFVAHICACGFILIANLEVQYQSSLFDQTWLAVHSLDPLNEPFKVYINALYYSLITMSTIGYGDIVPVTVQEKLYVIFMTQVACGVFAYAVNTIGQIFYNIDQQEELYLSKKKEVENYLKQRNIEKSIQIKILSYLEFMNKNGRLYISSQNALENITPQLRDEVQRDFYGGIIAKSEMLKLFSNTFLKKLALIMNEVSLKPGELLYREGEIDRRFYFIYFGEMEVFRTHQNGHYSKEVKLCTLNKQEFIGLESLYSKELRNHSMRSLYISHIVYCDCEQFYQLIRQFPMDLERYAMIKDSVNFGGQKLDKCLMCGLQHSTKDCSLINFKPFSVDRLRNQFLDECNQIQSRKVFKRCKQRNKQTMVRRSNFANVAKKMRINLIYQLQETDDILSKVDLDEIYQNFEDTDDQYAMSYLPPITFQVEGDLILDASEDFSDESSNLEFAKNKPSSNLGEDRLQQHSVRSQKKFSWANPYQPDQSSKLGFNLHSNDGSQLLSNLQSPYQPSIAINQFPSQEGSSQIKVSKDIDAQSSESVELKPIKSTASTVKQLKLFADNQEPQQSSNQMNQLKELLLVKKRAQTFISSSEELKNENFNMKIAIQSPLKIFKKTDIDNSLIIRPQEKLSFPLKSEVICNSQAKVLYSKMASVVSRSGVQSSNKISSNQRYVEMAIQQKLIQNVDLDFQKSYIYYYPMHNLQKVLESCPSNKQNINNDNNQSHRQLMQSYKSMFHQKSSFLDENLLMQQQEKPIDEEKQNNESFELRKELVELDGNIQEIEQVEDSSVESHRANRIAQLLQKKQRLLYLLTGKEKPPPMPGLISNTIRASAESNLRRSNQQLSQSEKSSKKPSKKFDQESDDNHSILQINL